MKLIKEDVQSLRTEIQNVLDAHGFNGFELTVERARYGQTEATFQLKAKIKGAPTDAETYMHRVADAYKIDVDKVATWQGRRFKLHHVNRNARKYMFIARCLENEELYKFTFVQAQAMFGK